MTTLNATYPSLIDVAKRMDPDGKAAVIAELLSQTNSLLEDMPFFEGNLPTGHRCTVRTGLPAAAWRKLNGGVAPSKSTTAQIDERVGMLEAFGECDKDLAEMSGNVGAFRMSEANAFIEAMNQEMAQTVIYGDHTSAPEEFLGLAPRYAAISGATNALNIVNGDATSGDTVCTSVWLNVWGANTVHGIYPKGSKAGLIHEDLGLETKENAGGVTGSLARVYRDHWQWKCGIALKDWRYVVRIANVKTTALTKTGTTGSDLIDLMAQALDVPPSLSAGRPVFYCNRLVHSYLRRQIGNKSNVWLSMDQVGGKPVMSFGGVPIRRLDQITNAETRFA
jgi:hypothetical protein